MMLSTLQSRCSIAPAFQGKWAVVARNETDTTTIPKLMAELEETQVEQPQYKTVWRLFKNKMVQDGTKTISLPLSMRYETKQLAGFVTHNTFDSVVLEKLKDNNTLIYEYERSRSRDINTFERKETSDFDYDKIIEEYSVRGFLKVAFLNMSAKLLRHIEWPHSL
jgi:transaldolase